MILRKIFSGSTRVPFIFLSVACGLLSATVFSQVQPTINIDEIPQKQVRNYIEERNINYMQNFSSIHPSWNKGVDKSTFHYREKKFFLKEKLSDVWECYINANPTKVWKGHFVRLGLMLSKRSNTVEYLNNCSFPHVDTGQVFFLNLRLLKGLLNVPMAFEITSIDPVEKIIEFSYIEGNKSQGKQTIQFFDNGDGHTRIDHRSYFKSDSPLRDDLLYPYFHKKLIREFHRNMSHLVRAIKPADSVTIEKG